MEKVITKVSNSFSFMRVPALWDTRGDVSLGNKIVVLFWVVLAVNVVALSALLAYFGFDFVYTKISEFIIHKLSRITTQGAFIATFAIGIIVEAFMIRNGKSVLQRLLKPSKSAQVDILMFIFHVTGIVALLYALMTFGASEWLPYILKRMPAIDVFFFTDNPWVKFTIIYLVTSMLAYWVHRLAHTWQWCWEGHKFHHAATEMTMLTALRNNPVGSLLGLFVVGIPAAILGKSGLAPLAGFATLNVIHNMLIHSNFGWGYGWVGKYLIVSPRNHRIHHSTYEGHINKNYGEKLVIWDRIFGTYYDGPVDPVEFGFEGNPYNKHGVLYDLIEGMLSTLSGLYRVMLRGCRFFLPR